MYFNSSRVAGRQLYANLKSALAALPTAKRYLADTKSDQARIKFCPKLAGYFIQHNQNGKMY